MTNHKLEKEETEILESFERGEWVSVPNVKKEIEKYKDRVRCRFVWRPKFLSNAAA